MKLGGSQSLVQVILVNINTRSRSPRLPYHHFCLRGLGGGWHGRAPRREVWLLSGFQPRSRGRRGCQRVLRHGRCGRCSSSTRWLTFSCSSSSSSPGCARASSTECWTIQLRSERIRAVQTVQKTVLGGRRSCDQQRQVSAVLRFESKVPQMQSILIVVDIPVVQQKTVENPQVQFLVVWEVVRMPG